MVSGELAKLLSEVLHRKIMSEQPAREAMIMKYTIWFRFPRTKAAIRLPTIWEEIKISQNREKNNPLLDLVAH